MKEKAVFLDRDGTINVDKGYIYKIEDFEWLPDTLDALRKLYLNGYVLIIITNQSGIGRGFYAESDFLKLTSWMLRFLIDRGIYITQVFYCPHHPQAELLKYRMKCKCRKPEVGLFLHAADKYDIDLSRSYAIGDRLRDCAICEAGECRGFVVGRNENAKVIDEIRDGIYERIRYADNLLECTKIICQ